ncbi:hypothetical protein BYT27DRAFT_6860477 [Phlegmacium glaucopus]|nr:hypothetical protein BYT27DRAFT_6860477 [Phlegmacium glaucopus]
MATSPAYQRPAFKSRPPLPFLDTLAKMNFVLGAGFGVKKAPKGKVVARLPFEPWNNFGIVWIMVWMWIQDIHGFSSEPSPVLLGERAGVGIGSRGEGGAVTATVADFNFGFRSISASASIMEFASPSWQIWIQEFQCLPLLRRFFGILLLRPSLLHPPYT